MSKQGVILHVCGLFCREFVGALEQIRRLSYDDNVSARQKYCAGYCVFCLCPLGVVHALRVYEFVQKCLDASE